MVTRLKEQREQQMHIVQNFDEEKTRLVRSGGSMAEDTKNMVS